MRNASVKSWPARLTMLLLPALFVQAPGGFSEGAAASLSCPSMEVDITAQSTNSVSFSWDSVGPATVYKVRYYRAEDGYTSSYHYTGATSIQFASLPAGTYAFYFYTVCEGETSPPTIVDDLLMG
jgi:hypothetical protein